MKDYSAENRYRIAEDLGIPNEYIGAIRQIQDSIYFDIKGGRSFNATLTKTGKYKKHSVRVDLQ